MSFMNFSVPFGFFTESHDFADSWSLSDIFMYPDGLDILLFLNQSGNLRYPDDLMSSPLGSLSVTPENVHLDPDRKLVLFFGEQLHTDKGFRLVLQKDVVDPD